jgi:transcriptional regulator GlxA family with amidase domain
MRTPCPAKTRTPAHEQTRYHLPWRSRRSPRDPGTGRGLRTCADRHDAKGQMSLFAADTHFVVYMNARDPTPSQELHSRDAKSDRVQIALAFARQNLREPLTVELLADAARLSPRQFSRVFRAETDLSQAKAIENLRIEATRFMLEQGRLPIEEIARETGFGDRERMRSVSFVPSVHAPSPSQRSASAGDHLIVR